MKQKTKTRGANIPVPQSKEDAANYIREVGICNRGLGRIEADMNDQITKIKEEHEKKAAPLRDKVVALTEGLKLWAEASRQSLTDGFKVKSVDLGTGKISWRLRPPSVRLTKLEAVLAALKSLGLQRFIRTKEEPNKEAMLAEPDVARTVPGVAIATEGEDFIVEPFEVELAQSNGEGK